MSYPKEEWKARKIEFIRHLRGGTGRKSVTVHIPDIAYDLGRRVGSIQAVVDRLRNDGSIRTINHGKRGVEILFADDIASRYDNLTTNYKITERKIKNSPIYKKSVAEEAVHGAVSTPKLSLLGEDFRVSVAQISESNTRDYHILLVSEHGTFEGFITRLLSGPQLSDI